MRVSKKIKIRIEMDALDLLTQILSHSQLNSGSKYSFNPSPQGLWCLCHCVVWLPHYSCAGSFLSGFTFVPTFMKLFNGGTCQQLRAYCSCRAPEFDSQHPHLVAHNLLYGIYRMQHHFFGHHGQLHSSANLHRDTDVYTQLTIEQNIF